MGNKLNLNKSSAHVKNNYPLIYHSTKEARGYQTAEAIFILLKHNRPYHQILLQG
jgi:hypothetical protein